MNETLKPSDRGQPQIEELVEAAEQKAKNNAGQNNTVNIFLANSDCIFSFDKTQDIDFSKVGGKAINLIKLKKAGFPVPNGFCITTDVHRYFIEHGRLPDGLVDKIKIMKEALGGKIAIRSSANCEDGERLSMAGVFHSYYVLHNEEIGPAIERILMQSRSIEVAQYMAIHGKSTKDIEMGLIIQQLIEPEIAGVVYTGIHIRSLLIQYVDGFGAKLVDGKTHGSAMLLDQNDRILESIGFERRPLSQGTIGQISGHSRAIEGLFQDTPQDIEFAYRDGTLHIVQSRTLTVNPGKVELRETPEECLEATKRKLWHLVEKEKQELRTETAIFSDANYSELLPRPTEMDYGVYVYCFTGSNGFPGGTQIGRVEMGYQAGEESIGIIKYIGGKVYFSIGRNAALYHIGFPETRKEYFSTLVNEYLSAVEVDPGKGSYPQMSLYLQDPTLEDLRMRYGDRAEEYFQIYQKFILRMQDLADSFLSQFRDKELTEMTNFIESMQGIDLNSLSCQELVDHCMIILEHLRTKSCVNFVKSARLGFYYSQRLQALLKERLKIGSNEAEEMYSRLNQGLDGSAVTEANIAIADAGSEEEAIEIARQLVGHFSTGEMLEIRHAPLRDAPDALQAYVRGIRSVGQYREQFEKQRKIRQEAPQSLLQDLPYEEKHELANVIFSSQTYMALRETIKYHFAKENLLLRDALEVLNKKLVLEDGDIYFIYPRELRELITDPQSMAHIIRARRQSFENYKKLDMPNIIRESDINKLSLTGEDNDDFSEAVGKFLAEGLALEGIVVNLDEYKNLDDVREVMRRYKEQGILIVLVATQMNLSHDPFIAQASGLVIENAGIVAHGAQRARELGKGAIGGIRSRYLKTGMNVLFDPAARFIKKLT